MQNHCHGEWRVTLKLSVGIHTTQTSSSSQPRTVSFITTTSEKHRRVRRQASLSGYFKHMMNPYLLSILTLASPGFMATGSTDKQVKLWNIQASGPSMVVSQDLDVGKVFSTSFTPDEEVGFRLAVAGSKGAVQIWVRAHLFLGVISKLTDDRTRLQIQQ